MVSRRDKKAAASGTGASTAYPRVAAMTMTKGTDAKGLEEEQKS
jgi:hypothetical protein